MIMGVRDRLNRLTGEDAHRHKEREAAGPREEMRALRRRIDAIMARQPQQMPAPAKIRPEVRPLERVLDGEERRNDHGACFVSTAVTAASIFHGHRPVGDGVALDMGRAALLAGDERIARCSAVEGLFLDTETTGLSGGTGTTAFLIGLGWWDAGSFVTQQIFLRDFSDEAAALALLNDIVKTRKFIITFNGKAFDIGLLRTRFILNRRSDPFADMPHLDLLFPSRRLVGHRLENSRLATLEAEILGFRRRGDVPGYEIPQRYFDWLRRRDARVLEDVFLHNRFDVISMAVLAVHLSELIDPSGCDGGAVHDDLFAASRLLIERGAHAEGVQILEMLAEQGKGLLRNEAHKALSLFHKRRGRWEKAVEIWERMIGDDPADIFALQEMAKWCEHRAGDFEKAMVLVDQALENAEESSEPWHALIYRRNRLCRRCR